MSEFEKICQELYDNQFYGAIKKLKSIIEEEYAIEYGKRLLSMVDRAKELREEILKFAKKKAEDLLIQGLDEYAEWKVATITYRTLEYDFYYRWTPEEICLMNVRRDLGVIQKEFIIQYWFRRPEDVTIYLPVPSLQGGYAPWLFDGEYLFKDIKEFLDVVFKMNLKRKYPHMWKAFQSTINMMKRETVSPYEVVEFAFDNFIEVRELFTERKKKYLETMMKYDTLFPREGLESYYEAPKNMLRYFKENPNGFEEKLKFAEKHADEYLEKKREEIRDLIYKK